MYAAVTFVIVALLSLLFTRVATGVLIATGVPPASAAFQARSAFSGAGFTTTESENVVNHPVRRRVIGTTMFVGAIGTPAMVVTVLLGFLAPGSTLPSHILLAVGGLAVLVLLVMSKRVTAWLVGLGQRYAEPRISAALAEEASHLLELGDGYVIAEVQLSTHLQMRSVAGLQQVMPKFTILGVRTSKPAPRYHGGRATDFELTPGDSVVLQGHIDDVAALSHAGGDPAGDRTS